MTAIYRRGGTFGQQRSKQTIKYRPERPACHHQKPVPNIRNMHNKRHAAVTFGNRAEMHPQHVCIARRRAAERVFKQ